MLETRGYRVVACTTGQQALEAFKQGERALHRRGRELHVGRIALRAREARRERPQEEREENADREGPC